MLDEGEGGHLVLDDDKVRRGDISVYTSNAVTWPESTSISCFVSVDVWLAQMQDGGRGRASPSAREIESVQSVGMARGRERERKEY